MPRSDTAESASRRVTLNFSDGDYSRLKQMAGARKITVAELLRRSVSLQAYLDEAVGQAARAGSLPPLTSLTPAQAQQTLVAAQHIR